MTKNCIKCKETKDLSVFYKMKAWRPTDDGYDYYCKVCRNASIKKTLNNNKRKCSTTGCDNPHYARTVCKCCYHKLLRREKNVKK